MIFPYSPNRGMDVRPLLFRNGTLIACLLNKKDFREALKAGFESLDIKYIMEDIRDKETIRHLYDEDISAVIVECSIAGPDGKALLDLINNLARRVPVIAIGERKNATELIPPSMLDNVVWLESPQVDEVLEVLTWSGAIGNQTISVKNRKTVPIYNIQIPLNMVRRDGAISMLVIDTTKFQKVATTYGAETYAELQQFFEHILLEFWGKKGFFRKKDFLCRKSPDSNTYYIFLQQARQGTHMPDPGDLEKLSDRLTAALMRRVWKELGNYKKDRMISRLLRVIPDFYIGHSTRLANPCQEPKETIDSLFHRAQEGARIQLSRLRARQSEFIQTLCQTNGLLIPHFQAVFSVGDINKEMMRKFKEGGNIFHIKSSLVSFESLIRICQDKVASSLLSTDLLALDTKYMSPDVLFAIASRTKLSLELDQACMRAAAAGFRGIPGNLMVNVLPRNLYLIDHLLHFIPKDKHVIFELSESEAIFNYDLLLAMRKRLRELGFGLAADDFGRGYNSLDTVLKLRPNIIKLDRSLIQNIDQEPSKQAFVSGLVRAAKMSKAKILAEGVETWDEFAIIKTMKVDLVQGYLFHRPQSLEEIQRDLGIEPEETKSVA